VYRALLAGRFLLAKYALIQPFIGVGIKRLVMFAIVAGIRTAALIKPDHIADRLLFTIDAFTRHYPAPANKDALIIHI
jgi:hypothetical protein